MFLLFAFLAVACEREGADAGNDDDAASSPRFEVGDLDVERTFTPYADGAEEPIIAGIQGGFHIFVDGRMLDDPGDDEYLVRLELTYDDGAPLTEIEHLRAPALSDHDGNPTFPEMIIFVPGPDLGDTDVVLRASVVDSDIPFEGADARLHLLPVASE